MDAYSAVCANPLMLKLLFSTDRGVWGWVGGGVGGAGGGGGRVCIKAGDGQKDWVAFKEELVPGCRKTWVVVKQELRAKNQET